MTKRIRTALAALLIAFAIAFSASQLGGFSWMSSDTAGIRPDSRTMAVTAVQAFAERALR
jgi:hypothetical protein